VSITELSIKRPSLVVVIFTVLGILGYISYKQLGYELLPRFSPPVITISTVYPGASPGEVENSVTKKIEDGISSLENISTVKSFSQENMSIVIVELNQSANVDLALQDAQRKVNGIMMLLPEQAKTPVLGKFSISELPILRMGALSNMPPTEFYQLVKDRIKPTLSKIPGVAQITLIGGEEREIRVNVDEQKLAAYKLSLLQVNQAINSANLDFPTGRVKGQEEQLTIRLAGKFQSTDELKNLVVATTPQGSPIKLQDVAEVVDAQKDVANINRINGETAIGILVQKQTDANAVEISRIVREEVARLETVYAKENVKFNIAQDSSEFTIAAADAVTHDLMIAVILVALVMLVFLHSLRNSFIVMLAIPASLISTFIAMYLFGFTLNLMTLLALSLVVGILVDDSIVVLENIYRHMEMGKDRRTAALDGRNEIGFTALSITLVDVVVFLPISLVSGLVADILRQFSLVVVVSTMLSLFVSFTVTPLLASRFSRLEHLSKDSFFGRIGLWFESMIDSMTRGYKDMLAWSLNHKAITLITTAVLFFGSFGLFALGLIGSEFVSAGDRGEFVVNIELDNSQTIENTNLATQKAERVILSRPDVKKVFANVGGSSSMMLGQAAQNKSELTVILVPQEERTAPTEQVSREIRAQLEEIPGLKVRTNKISIMGGADQAPIMMHISGPDLDTVMAAANQVKELIRQIPGTEDVKLTVEDGNPEISIQVDKEKMTSLGLNLASVGATMQTAFSGNDDSKFRESGTEYDIRVMLDAFDRHDISDVSDLSFINNRGEVVKLSQFATIQRTTGPSRLERKDRSTSVMIESQVAGRAAGTVGQDIEAKLSTIKLPAGVSYAWDGQMKNQKDGFGSLGLAFLASIIFVYLIMVALYDSYVYPFVVLFSIPVAIVGALLALALTQSTMSIFSILGIIMLVGLVAKNAILIVDFTNQLKAEGLKTYEALMQAGVARLRPILMTTMAMVIGLLPIALAKGAGAEWKNGLAWALIGGLTSSMLLTLVVVPAVYLLVDKVKARVSRLFGKGKEEAEPVTV
jgi:HAE1 family hydrophobic/amphiphilic exporter-1